MKTKETYPTRPGSPTPCKQALILGATIQDEPFLLINIYAPNKSAKQSSFFQALSEFISDEEYQVTN